jgi:hypothetical protein
MRFQKVMCTKNVRKLLMIALLGMVMAVSGCAIIASKHKLYDGEVANAVTILSSPTVQVTYIDNRDMGYSFVGQEKEFSVLPGKHTLIIEYADFWSPATGEDEKVVSPPVKLTFIAEPSQTYQVSHERLITLESSQAFAKTPVFFVKNIVTGNIVNAAFEASAPKIFVPKFKFETTPEYQFASDSDSAAPESAQKMSQKNTDIKFVGKNDNLVKASKGRVAQLQKLWSGTTPKEKAVFLQWITIK